MSLFDAGPEDSYVLPPPVTKSADRKRTERNASDIAAGRHPITKRPLAVTIEGHHGAGHTCGDCAFHVINQRAKRWHKCELNHTGGPATDLRISWPACSRWKPELEQV